MWCRHRGQVCQRKTAQPCSPRCGPGRSQRSRTSAVISSPTTLFLQTLRKPTWTLCTGLATSRLEVRTTKHSRGPRFVQFPFFFIRKFVIFLTPLQYLEQYAGLLGIGLISSSVSLKCLLYVLQAAFIYMCAAEERHVDSDH